MHGDGLVLRAAVPQAERDLDPVGRDRERDDAAAALQLDPVEHQHRQPGVLKRATHERVEVLAGAPDELARDRRLRDRPLGAEHVLADGLARAREPPGRDAGEHLLEHHPAQRVTVSEVRVGDQPDLSAAVCGPHTRPLDTHAPPAERDLASLVAMANRGAVGVALALRAHDVVDLLFHQLGEHAEPDADAQRQQAFLRCADQLAQRFLHAAGQHGLVDDRGLRDRYGLLHGGSSFDLWRITANAPNRNGRGGGTAVSSSTSYGTTSAATPSARRDASSPSSNASATPSRSPTGQRQPERTFPVRQREQRPRRAGGPLPPGGCRSEAGADRPLPDAWSSSVPGSVRLYGPRSRLCSSRSPTGLGWRDRSSSS